MKSQATQIRKFILENTNKHPHNLVSITMSKFQVSRTTVLRHIQHLINANKIMKTGNTKQITYTLVDKMNQKLTTNLNDSFDEYEFFNKHLKKLLKINLNNNSYEICEYVITELLNNCKDHSKSNNAIIHTSFNKDTLHCIISDKGIGLFETIKNNSPWTDIRDILFELNKGKLTRDPINHSGKGIFFSSRAVDRFKISANGYDYIRDNIEEDWTFCNSNVVKGTSVEIEISKNTHRNLKEIFEKYTDDFSFNKTDILVDLSQHYGERLISRSQAKRVCRRLDKFSHVTLDFKKVEAVGQGFADQLFRVYQKENPQLTIEYINANSNVDFMIKRSIAKD